MTADRFIRAYNQIDDHLRGLLDIDRSRYGFASVVDQAAKRYSVVRRYADDLKEFGALRNAIVHDKEYPSRIIADPRPEVVEAIERLAAVILDPPRVYPLFGGRCGGCRGTIPSQSRSGGSASTTTRSIPSSGTAASPGCSPPAAWPSGWPIPCTTAASSFDGVTVGDVLRHDDYEGRRVAFVAREATWYDAVEFFSPAKGKRRASLEAILITESGREDEELLGIITPRDLLNPPAGLA